MIQEYSWQVLPMDEVLHHFASRRFSLLCAIRRGQTTGVGALPSYDIGSFLKTQNTRNKKTKAAKFLKNDTQSQIFGSRWGTTTKNLLPTQSLTESYFLG